MTMQKPVWNKVQEHGDRVRARVASGSGVCKLCGRWQWEGRAEDPHNCEPAWPVKWFNVRTAPSFRYDRQSGTVEEEE